MNAIRRGWEKEVAQHDIFLEEWQLEKQKHAVIMEQWKLQTEWHERDVARWTREEDEHQERVRQQWAQEYERHAREDEEYEKAVARRWRREVEDHDQIDKERRKREEEDRQKLNMFWGGIEPHTCTTYATREYTAQLMNLPIAWEHRVEACKATPLEVHGTSYLPKSCEDKGPGAVIGRWEINRHEPDCATFWNWYKDKESLFPTYGFSVTPD
ncbi:hypothetical protein J3R83DRAFT_5753 [Lanmaoa asiatica]|nr:hypothetical protein J3R83DRAFT_5753 [Lanmaoa asiatica]